MVLPTVSLTTILSGCSGAGGDTTAGGRFESPLVQLQRLQGQVGHLHVDEVRYRPEDKLLFQCSYTFGVVNAENPQSMRYMAENLTHTIPGDSRRPGCVHLAYDGNIVYTTHRGNLRNPTFVSGWDLSGGAATEAAGRGRARGAGPGVGRGAAGRAGRTGGPGGGRAGGRGGLSLVQIPVLQEPGVSYEGIDVADHVVYVAIRSDGLGAYRRDPATNRLTRVGTLSNIGNTWGVRVIGQTAYVTDIDGHLTIADVSTPERPTVVGRVALDGVPKGLAVDGQFVYVATGSAGIAVVDASAAAAPRVIATADTPGPALRVAYSHGRLFVAAWTDTRVYDVTTPSAPRFIGAVRLTTDVTYPDDEHPAATARTKGVAADGSNVFIGNWWVLYSYRLYADRPAPSLRLPETVNLTDFGRPAVGTTASVTIPVRNQGTAPLTILDAWTTNPSFRVAPSRLTLAPGAEGRLDLSYDAARSERETGLLRLRTDDPLQPVRSAFLVANQAELGVGQKLPTTKLRMLDGTDWSSDSVRGKVLVLAYFATFCPVCAEHVPELERHFYKKYKDRGVMVVAANYHDSSVEGGIDGVRDYIRRFGNSHPVGLEDAATPTYSALVAAYRGANPFPVDVVVNRDGVITYITREYDPAGLEAAIEEALEH